jgi:hypothetical protein
MKKKFDADRYGMIVCPSCNGIGTQAEPSKSIKAVCPECGGFGLVRKSEEDTLQGKKFLE